MNDINNLDPNDEGLRAVMGDKFQDISGGQKPVCKKVEQVPEKKSCRKVPDAQREPVKAAPGFMDRLKDAACSVAKPAVLGLFFFWCQQCQKMDSTTAVCAMFACVAVAAFHMGRLFYAGE